jgi:hypothetical protein
MPVICRVPAAAANAFRGKMMIFPSTSAGRAGALAAVCATALSVAIIGAASASAAENTLPFNHAALTANRHTVAGRNAAVSGRNATLTSSRGQVPAPCTTTVTGTHVTPLTVTHGKTCLVNATQDAQVMVGPGASLSATNSEINGTVTAAKAASITYCGSAENGILTVTGTTGAVTLGGTLPGGTACASDTITGLVTISGTAGQVAVSRLKDTGTLTLSGNTGGITLNGIILSGLAYVQSNTGKAAVTVSGNSINGLLACTGNTPAPGDNHAVNTVNGIASGQCTRLAG